MENRDVRMVYVLLDGVGDLPHPDLGGRTPLEAASTPALDSMAASGASGRVITVGRGIAPESDIAVFNMLGYRFGHDDYAGRGVIEAVGVGMDFRDGDLALRGNFATLGGGGEITDRRAGRQIARADAEAVSGEIEEGVRLSGAEVAVAPTIGHRVTVRIRDPSGPLSPRISNTDPAYANVGGMGVAREAGGPMRVERSAPLAGGDAGAGRAAGLVNEFSDQAMDILGRSPVNARRAGEGARELSCILLRDAGCARPRVAPINEKYSMDFACIVDMPVEIGIARILGMRMFEAGGLEDYEEKARVAAAAMNDHNAIYVHLKGPDEFGHDGDARGKTASIEDIDRRFFGPLLDGIDTGRVAVVVSADHSTPCTAGGHSDDPVPLLVSGGGVRGDGTARMTEAQAARGGLGMLDGAQVLGRALGLLRSQRA